MIPVPPPYDDCDTRDCRYCLDAPVCPYLLDLFADDISSDSFDEVLIL